MAGYGFDFDFAVDFKRVIDMEIVEKLSEDGIDPFSMDLKVGLSSHAVQRMEDTEGRWVENEDLIDLLQKKGHKLFDVSVGEEVAIVRDDSKLAIIGKLYQTDDTLILAVMTIIRKVIVKEGREIEKCVFIKKGTKAV